MPKRKNISKLKSYEDALVNIFKCGGKCYSCHRLCYDPSFVARMTMKKNNPKLYALLDSLDWRRVIIRKNGGYKIKRGR